MSRTYRCKHTLLAFIFRQTHESLVTHANNEGRIGSVYNNLPAGELKAEFEQWAAANYPTLWQELEKIGRVVNPFNKVVDRFKVQKRILKA